MSFLQSGEEFAVQSAIYFSYNKKYIIKSRIEFNVLVLSFEWTGNLVLYTPFLLLKATNICAQPEPRFEIN